MVMGSIRQKTEVVVVGGGPGGYVAAIRAADLGREVLLVERRERLGGVCLLEGCIPSKALIAAVEVLEAAREAEKMGLHFSGLTIDQGGLRAHTEGVIGSLSKGIDGLLARRGIEVVHGSARLTGPHSLTLEGSDISGIDFDHCILATGSTPVMPDPWRDLGLWTSTEALRLDSVPPRLLVVGGGYIGLELGLVYAGLGSAVTVAELMPELLGGADQDLVQPVRRRCFKRFDKVFVETKVERIERDGGVFSVTLASKSGSSTIEVDQVLVAIGRRPNTSGLGLEGVGVQVDPRGMVPVDERMRTVLPHLYAIGDIVAGPGLAHKASREGKVAAEVISGRAAAFDNVAIPAVVFTDPEVAWVGPTEAEARASGRKIRVGKFPMSALGRARTIGRTDGLAKVIVDDESGLVIGVGLAGPHASDMIATAALALEMGAVAEDLTSTIFPHPTFSEAIMEAAEVAEGHATHLAPGGPLRH